MGGRGLCAWAPLVRAACEEPPPPVPGYVADSGIVMPALPVFWLDDRRVLFTRLVAIDKSEGREDPFDSFVTVWHTDTGEVEKIDHGYSPRFCASPATDSVSYTSGYLGEGAKAVRIYAIGPF